MYSKLALFTSGLLSSAAALPNALTHLSDRSPVGTLGARGDYFSGNWCGMVKNASVKSVVSTWTVPSVSVPKGQPVDQLYEWYQWVGIDGDGRSCDTLLQGGTGSSILNGTVSTYFWYQFYPEMPYSWRTSEIDVKPGDKVRVKVTAHSATNGTVKLENLTTRKNKSFNLQSKTPLCFTTVEWTGEKPGPNLPEFSNFDFKKCSAITSDGKKIDASSSEQWYLDGTNSKCNAALKGGSTVSIIDGSP